MGGGLESRCVGRVYGADGAVRRHHVASCWHFTPFHEEDAQSNNPQEMVAFVFRLEECFM